MKLQHLLFTLILSLAVPVAQAHDYHASITDVKFNPRSQSLEVAVKVFLDDLENALSKRTKSKVTYSNSSQVQQQVNEYVQAMLSFETTKGKPLKQQFIGSEEEGDAVWIYVEVPVHAASLSQLYIKNAVLTELFSDQMNVLNVNYKGNVNSVLFQRGETSKKLSF